MVKNYPKYCSDALNDFITQFQIEQNKIDVCKFDSLKWWIISTKRKVSSTKKNAYQKLIQGDSLI